MRLATGPEAVANWLWQLVWTAGCPSCGVRIQKNGGCPHMSCAACAEEFCWVCLLPYELHHQFCLAGALDRVVAPVAMGMIGLSCTGLLDVFGWAAAAANLPARLLWLAMLGLSFVGAVETKRQLNTWLPSLAVSRPNRPCWRLWELVLLWLFWGLQAASWAGWSPFNPLSWGEAGLRLFCSVAIPLIGLGMTVLAGALRPESRNTSKGAVLCVIKCLVVALAGYWFANSFFGPSGPGIFGKASLTGHTTLVLEGVGRVAATMLEMGARMASSAAELAAIGGITALTAATTAACAWCGRRLMRREESIVLPRVLHQV